MEGEEDDEDDDVLGGEEELPPPGHLLGALGPRGEVLGDLPGGELGLADVAEVPRQVDRLPLHQARQQGHVGRLPPPRGKLHPDTLQLVTQHLATVLGLGPGVEGEGGGVRGGEEVGRGEEVG